MDPDALMADLRARAAEQRALGAIPVGLVDELDRFAADVLRRSAVPPSGDPVLKATMQTLVQRASDLGDVAPALHLFCDQVVEVLEAAAQRITTLEGLVFRAERTLERVERLEEAEARRGFRPWYPTGAFESTFRGTVESAMPGARANAELLRGCDPVLDLGCGRGELLLALRDQGTVASGVDRDPSLAHHGRALGLRIEEADLLDHLRSVPDRSLGAISLVQVIEHLSAQEQLDLVALAVAKLRDGGKLLIESVNPLSLYVYTHAMYLDPTHTQPVHPYYLCFLVEQAGFASNHLDFRSGVPIEECVDRSVLSTEVRAAFDKILQFLEAPQDYVLVATR